MVLQVARGLAERLAPLQQLRLQRYERQFRASYGLCRGVFPSFEAARGSAPPHAQVGHNLAEYAPHHLDRADHIEPYDYPVLLWLDRILSSHDLAVFDYGGNVGVHYHAYRKYLAYAPGLSWTVCELPELVKLGEQLARTREATGLAFTTEFCRAEGSQVFLAAGALQYIDEPLWNRLAGLENLPEHLLLNKLPLYGGGSFITLQHGPTYAPQRVYNRDEFVGGLTQLGYQVIDAWGVPGFACHVPFHAGLSVPEYSGLYLRRPH